MNEIIFEYNLKCKIQTVNINTYKLDFEVCL